MQLGIVCLRRRGLVVKAVAGKARGPGFDSSSDQNVFPISMCMKR